MKSFDGKVVIVTGASSGLGEAAALKFAREGAKVVLAARRKEKSQAVLQKIEALGGTALFIETDVTRRSDIEALVAKTVAAFGGLDYAVNNAGIVGSVRTPTADVEEEVWDAVMATNLKAVWLCMKYQIPAMLARGRGAIVNIASIYGYKPSDVGHVAYCTSKHAVIGLSKTAAIDYARQGIRVNVVAPGFTRTEMVDPTVEENREVFAALAAKYSAMNRLGLAEETAEAISWLCSDAASFVNGAVLPVDGGDTTRFY